jgi:long-subunit acyl-CoA synthetase (AMP-forming)
MVDDAAQLLANPIHRIADARAAPRLGRRDAARRRRKHHRARVMRPDDLAVLRFTSGSTDS